MIIEFSLDRAVLLPGAERTQVELVGDFLAMDEDSARAASQGSRVLLISLDLLVDLERFSRCLKRT